MTKAEVIDLARTVQEHGDAEYRRGFREGYDKCLRDVTDKCWDRLVKARTSEEFMEALKQ